MDIGKTERTVVVEPVEDPFRRDEVPVEPTPVEVPQREPEKVPA